MKYTYIATSTFGLEAVVKREVEKIGGESIKVENGRVEFQGDLSLIAKGNLWFRVADRVLVKLGEFRAESFESLFNQTFELPWEEWIEEDGNFIVEGKSVKSKLFSIKDCQSITEKAVIKKLQTKYQKDWFEKSGPRYKIQVSLLNDIATLTLDTSGTGLHKRGYRESAVEAPIKETLAAAMIELSYWNKEKILIDPFCGSGTIPIEAAMIGRNMAPGLSRKFDAEQWQVIPSDIWKKERAEALKAIDQEANIRIYGYDIDKNAIQIAMENAFNAGVDDCIEFKTKKFGEMALKEDYGVIICNPPYGERLGELREVKKLYELMGKVFSQSTTWSKYIITSFEEFEKYYGKKADRKRKLFNGKLKVEYYQYYGLKPKKKTEA